MPAEHLHAVSHLTTTLTGPLRQFETLLLIQQARIVTWLRAVWRTTPAPLYTSVDLRNVGFKLAPVDINLIPAVSDSPNPAFQPPSILAMQTKIEQLCETASNIQVIPEGHIRNLYYLVSMATLRATILKMGYQIRIGSLWPDLKTPEQVALPSGRYIQLEPLIKRNRRVDVVDYDACLVRNVEAFLESVLKKYDEYGIGKPSFVAIKFMLQEGVYNFETWLAQVAVAKTVVYMIDHFVADGFYRVHGAWQQRKSEFAWHAVRAAGFRRILQHARPHSRARRQTEPFPYLLRRARPPSPTGGRTRTGRTQRSNMKHSL